MTIIMSMNELSPSTVQSMVREAGAKLTATISKSGSFYRDVERLSLPSHHRVIHVIVRLNPTSHSPMTSPDIPLSLPGGLIWQTLWQFYMANKPLWQHYRS